MRFVASRKKSTRNKSEINLARWKGFCGGADDEANYEGEEADNGDDGRAISAWAKEGERDNFG